MKPPSQDAEHLRMLSIGTYVVAGVTSLFAMFPIIHVGIGIAIMTGMIKPEPQQKDFPDFWFGLFFTTMGSIAILWGLTLAAMMAFAARNLSQQRSYMFCVIIAGLECTIFPFGTIVGVLSMIVLMRSSVREMFGVESFSQQTGTTACPP